MSKYIPLILFTVLTNFGSQILLKKGMTSIDQFEISREGLTKSALNVAFSPYVIAGLLVMVISMASHLVVLSRVDISYAYPFLGLSFILTAAWGHFILHEDVNLWRWAGVALISSGVALVAKS
ncbi:EamA family transporter [Pelagicoccus sp. SDUM812002]|uniref:EamA family transporter n=1 Tax=Pelagicoccus sp. SDUM812002 TaxID=3041266 RepID=UPI00280E0415|nr:EamA family transporter [Pelagicoccus sp. SDUM812002]MDQ8187862.1 EamA family transporter [Pelagicoccus sp. SDUM812002]